MDAALHHGCRQVMRAGDDVRDDFGVGGVWYARLENADDGCRPVAEADCLAKHRGIALQRGRPKTVCEYHCSGCTRPIVASVEQTAENGPQSHHVEVGAADDAGPDFARLAESHHGEPDGGEITELADLLDGRLQVVNLGYREE